MKPTLAFTKNEQRQRELAFAEYEREMEAYENTPAGQYMRTPPQRPEWLTKLAWESYQQGLMMVAIHNDIVERLWLYRRACRDHEPAAAVIVLSWGKTDAQLADLWNYPDDRLHSVINPVGKAVTPPPLVIRQSTGERF